MIRPGICRNCLAEFSYEVGGGKHRPLCQTCETTYKWCPPCGYALPREGFGNCAPMRDGLDAMCKRCRSERSKGRRQVRDPRQDRDHKLRTRYNLSLDEYDALVAEQDGKCAICGDAPARLVVDHCHDTGAVRGIICGPCNKGLGHFRDNLDRVVAAAAYLMRPVQCERTAG